MNNKRRKVSLFHDPVFCAGGILVGVFFFGAIFIGQILSEKAGQIDITQKLLSPSFVHLLGTDPFGRDVFLMLFVAAKNSILIAVSSVGIGLLCGIPLGFWASLRKCGLSQILDGANDFVFAFPPLITAILLASVYGPGTGTAILAIGLFNIPVFARITKNASLPVWQEDFTQMAETFGKGKFRIFLDHLFLHIFPSILVQVNVQFPMAILAEAALGYLGLSVPPPAPTWGKMLLDSQSYFELNPWLAISPGAAVVLFVLGFNLIGDSLVKHFNPKQNIFR